MQDKLIGYGLLVAGVLVILFAGFNIYQVFTRQIRPVQLFDFPAISIDSGEIATGSLPVELLPKEVLNDSSNVIAHLLLMGFVVNIGYKLASIGVMMTKTLEVKMKEAGTPPPKT